MKVSGIKSKLLLAFITVLVIITGLNVVLASYLTTQQSEREAFSGLKRQTVLLQNELQETAIDLWAIAEKNVAGINNLSDLSTLYAKTQQFITYPEEAAANERGFLFTKIISLNRLQVILQTADFSSAAVYVDNELSHYITTTEAGMNAVRGDDRPLFKTGRNQTGDLDFGNWPNWAEGTPPSLIMPHIAPVKRTTISFAFTSEQMLILQIVVPVQAIVRTVMIGNVTLGSPEGLLVDNPVIASPELLNISRPGQNKPKVIGAFVFRKIFDKTFLEEIAQKTGLLPALYSPDGIHQIELVDLKMDPASLALWARERLSANDRQIQQRTIAVDRESYYQTLSLWQFEEKKQLIIGFAQSAASTAQKVGEAVTGLVGIAGLVLLVGGVIGYLLFDRLIHPIRTLTEAVSQIGLSTPQESPNTPVMPIASDRLVEIELHADDEVGQLTIAFNLMIRQLRQSLETLEQRVVERTKELQIAKDNAEHSKQLAETANKAKSDFLANMSHELRTPLNAILGYADILKRHGGYTGSITDGLEIIHRSGEHLLTLINDMLDLTKIEAGKLELNPTPFHLPEFLHEIIGIIRARAEAKGLSLSYEALSSLPDTVLADEKRLRQVLLNLLGNAVKFTDKGRVTLTVKCDDLKLGDLKSEPAVITQHVTCITFEVQDTGRGIEKYELERIFEPFEQVRGAEQRAEGTGLGLSISRQIVGLMGSRLEVKSEPGHGSIFWFEVPVPVTSSSRTDTSAVAREILGYQGERRCILVADDKTYNRQLLKEVLVPLGFDVQLAENGQQAVKKAQSLRPDAILMDMVMPIKSGFEAIRELRKQSEFSNAFIIAISASVLKADEEESRLAGCDAFLPKPINIDKLLDLLKTHLKLTWLYAEPLAPAANTASLVPPAPELLETLNELVRRGRILEIQEQAAKLKEVDDAFIPFANTLQELAKDFEIEKIKTFIKQFFHEEQGDDG